MNVQGVLDLAPPLPPSLKPAPRSTSAEALCEIKATGVLGEQQRAVLVALAEVCRCFEGPWGRTSREVARGSGVDRYVVARRLPELEREGLVERYDVRLCDVTERKAITWKPTAAGHQAVRERLVP